MDGALSQEEDLNTEGHWGNTPTGVKCVERKAMTDSAVLFGVSPTEEDREAEAWCAAEYDRRRAKQQERRESLLEKARAMDDFEDANSNLGFAMLFACPDVLREGPRQEVRLTREYPVLYPSMDRHPSIFSWAASVPYEDIGRAEDLLDDLEGMQNSMLDDC